MTPLNYLIAADLAQKAGHVFYARALIVCYLAAKRREEMFGQIEQTKTAKAA